ncbi:DNA cytosine methyltransferase [Cellulomonas endometrii]|uniref:DNA cytosine methyltransferase n=1 Tax=Cellulomonas endometrii TaxID=3036301 RepID=UPI0024ADAD08|nr:DNA cytosine methyltransferase [Cellulomonas endometrii]
MRTHKVHDHVSGKLSDLDRVVVQSVPAGGNWRDLPEDFPSARVRQIRESAARGEGSRSTYYGRLSWDRPSYTISTYLTRPGNGTFIHPELDRLITVREAARLQGFPDRVRFQGSMRQRCMQVGNAVPPPLAYQLGSTISATTVVDLFAGAGGVGLGLEMAGHTVLVSADNNPDAVRTIASAAGPDHDVQLRDLSREDELEALVASTVERLEGKSLGLLAGGPPCQGFSTAGPCRVDDPRNELVLRYLRAVELLRPREVLFENVVALKWRGRPFLDELIERLAVLGYHVEARILHTEAYGVPQLRRRLVLRASRVSSRIAWPAPTRAVLTPSFLGEQPGPLLDEPGPFTVRDAIADLAVDESSGLDVPVEARPATSRYARWAQGLIPPEHVFGKVTAELDERVTA